MNENKDEFLLNEWINKIENNLGNEQWIPIYDYKTDKFQSIGLFSALVPEKHIKSLLEGRDCSWDLHIGDGGPGFNFRFSNGKTMPEYCKYGNPNEIQPLVIVRNFYGIKEGYTEIAEEFRLYFNLYHDHSNNTYVRIKDDSDEEEVIRIKDNEILVNAKHIKEFIAIKNVKLALFFSICNYSEKTLEELGVKEISEYKSTDNYLYHYVVSNPKTFNDKKAIASIIGKKYISGIENFQPESLLSTEKKDYEDFIIEVDKEGKEISFTCNPKKLGNVFGANPHSPNYLRPIYFKRTVLSKYYEEPSKYSIKDGYLSCGGLWGIRIDNNHKKYVVAFLGDLGRDLPESHQKYWRSFNVPPDSSMSEVQIKRSFFAEFTDPTSPDLVFKQKLKQFKRLWKERFGWDIFKELNEKDKFHLTALRIPMKNEQTEFDSQVQSLTKIIIDSINDAEISKKITNKERDEKSIMKLEKFFSENDYKGYKDHIKFLRSLQDLRSKGVAHRKRKKYDQEYNKILNDLDIDSNNLSYVFKELLKLAIEFLDFLNSLIPSSSNTPSQKDKK